MKWSVFCFTLALFCLAIARPAVAMTVPVEASTASPLNVLQTAVADLVGGAEAVIASIESTVGNLASAITGNAAGTLLSNTASAAEAVASNAGVDAAEEPIASNPPAAPAPPPTSAAIVSPTLTAPTAAASDNIFELESTVSELAEGMKDLTALFEAQTPSSKIESQIASLQSALSLSLRGTGESYNASDYFPLGDGTGIAAASNIGQLSNVTISNASISSNSIPDLSGSYLSVSGGTLTGPINFAGSNQLLLDGGAPFLTSTSTSLYIGLLSGTSTADVQNTAVGYDTLASDGSGYSNSALGYQALMSNTTGYYNSAFGTSALLLNTTGIRNTAVGQSALQNATADANTAVGYRSLFLDTTGPDNVAVGYGSLATEGSATSTTAVGEYTGHGDGTGTFSNQGGTYIGYQAGYLANTGSDFNTMLGYDSGYNVTTGSNNLLLATATSSLAIANLTTGSQNILIGNNISLPSSTASGQLDIGNILYGTNITGTGSTLSSGNLGIGTTTPWATFSVAGPDTSATTPAFVVANSGNMSLLSVFDNGNVGIGTTTPGSIFSINGIANWTTATSTFYSTGGINLTGGCFSIDGTCVGGSSGSGTVGSGTQGQFPFYNAAGTMLTATSSLFLSQAGNVGIGTTSPRAMLDITGTSSQAVLSSEMISAVADRNFSSNTGDWTGTNWTIGSNVDTHTSGTNALTLTNSALSSAPTSGNLYQVTFTVNTTFAGNITPSIGSANGNVVGSALGSDTEVQIITATGAGALTFTPDANWTGTITNVSVMQLTPSSAIQVFRSSDSTDGLEIRSGGVGQTTNTFMGLGAGESNVTGNRNSAFGEFALLSNTTGFRNTAVGSVALDSNTTGIQNTALGVSALQDNTIGTDNTSVGYRSMLVNISGGTNTAIGESALQSLTAGSDNVALGYRAGLNITTGSNNIMIGYNINATSSSAMNTLNIGNLIFGIGINGTGNTVSSGNVGIGTSTPYSRLQVTGPDTASTSAFAVVNSASSTEFTVYDTGNAVLAGSLTQNSDQRLKTNISDLDGSSSLAEINALNPVTFNWIDPAKRSVPQFGFIAQQVQQIFPNLVSTTSPTALTPDGTLSLNYIDLISPIVAAIQELDKEVTSLASTVAGFAQSFTTAVLNATTGNFGQVNANELCLGSTCVTQAQLQALLAAGNQSASAPASPSTSPSSSAATDTPPVIQINGDNPATIQVGASYTDLGATITGPQADLNLGIQTYLNGVLESPITLDTSAAATDTIAYVVTDSQGLTSTSTRTVIVDAAAAPPASLPIATSSSATSTSQ
jgi:hypothetical protein